MNSSPSCSGTRQLFPLPTPFAMSAATAAGIPIADIFGIAEGPGGDGQSQRALEIARHCLSGWLRNAHLGELELSPSDEAFVRVEARRRQVFRELAGVLAQVETMQARKKGL
ncbi:hypothetical protein [Mitsuaria sp. 7]|uniref:hypothetical protein n=1 Tax=Mitsuaria sp. 7 TaxID=1658665 RepID=UPI0007DCD91C|nr:hypothetical protein [Mitsuaria sp. 7]ANH66625.1 hypothetical protein ABE85_01900 [Mitsuaria sp. 7]